MISPSPPMPKRRSDKRCESAAGIGGTHAVGDDVDIVVAAAVHLDEVELRHRDRLAAVTIFSPRMMSSKLSRSRITCTSAPLTSISGARGRLL